MTKILLTLTALVVSFKATVSLAHMGTHGYEGVAEAVTHQLTEANHLGMLALATLGLILAGAVMVRQRKEAKLKKSR